MILSSLFQSRKRGWSNPTKSFEPVGCSCIDVSTEAATADAQPEIPESQIPAVAKKHLASVPGVVYVNTPPIPIGGDGDPILLPNERLLQRFPNKRSMFKVSEWKVQMARQRCLRCNPDYDNNGQYNPWQQQQVVSHVHSDWTSSFRETCLDHLGGGAQAGIAYVTTERIIFVPKQATLVGFSIEIEDITSMKVAESDTIVDSWFFLCYVGNSMCTIPFMNEQRCRSFMNLIANLQFEHKIRRCLPPRKKSSTTTSVTTTAATATTAAAATNTITTTTTTTNNTTHTNNTPAFTTTKDQERRSVDEYAHKERPAADHVDGGLLRPPMHNRQESRGTRIAKMWEEEDRRLPSYDESEHALQRLMVQKGLLEVNQPLDRETDTNLIALASAPPTDPADAEFNEMQAQQELHQLSTSIPRGIITTYRR